MNNIYAWVPVTAPTLKGIEILVTPADAHSDTDETWMKIRVRVNGVKYSDRFGIPEEYQDPTNFPVFLTGLVLGWESGVIKELTANGVLD